MEVQRQLALKALKERSFDVLVIGGGATGAGIALDAQLRGLKVALIERFDFSSGTSSRSTKLVHGGVRYLEQAVLHLDRSQFKLVREALSERKILSEIAPHLVHWLPLLIPMYRRFGATYYHVGLRMYDWLAGKHLVHRSRLVSRQEALELCPQLKKTGLKGGVIYYDGQFDDARMALSILMTAAQEGAVLSNYVEAIGFERSGGTLSGVKLRDVLTSEEWSTSAQCVINATGPYTDRIRALDDPRCKPRLRVSSGTHIVLQRPNPGPQVGVLIPKTQDKRVLFVLPWLEHLVVGTTDSDSKLSDDPKPTPQEITFIQEEYQRYFEGNISNAAIQSSWSGLRPLIQDSGTPNTAALSRDHAFDESSSGLLSVFGGKWTTYRLMSQETVDKIFNQLKRVSPPCRTHEFKLVGGGLGLPQARKALEKCQLPKSTQDHLLRAYGDQSIGILDFLRNGGSELLHPQHPILVGEVDYCVRKEFVSRSSDFLFRRSRLAFLDKKAAEASFSKVHERLSQELQWTDAERKADLLDFSSQLTGKPLPG